MWPSLYVTVVLAQVNLPCSGLADPVQVPVFGGLVPSVLFWYSTVVLVTETFELTAYVYSGSPTVYTVLVLDHKNGFALVVASIVVFQSAS